jgi:hypothetical protein
VTSTLLKVSKEPYLLNSNSSLTFWKHLNDTIIVKHILTLLSRSPSFSFHSLTRQFFKVDVSASLDAKKLGNHSWVACCPALAALNMVAFQSRSSQAFPRPCDQSCNLLRLRSEPRVDSGWFPRGKLLANRQQHAPFNILQELHDLSANPVSTSLERSKFIKRHYSTQSHGPQDSSFLRITKGFHLGTIIFTWSYTS